MSSFDPRPFLIDIKGKAYLPVAARLLWLRHDEPAATLETELVTFTAEIAVVKATVRIPNGGSATGYGSEEPGGKFDPIERAETRAIGRALGALGFGTQFCFGDHDEGEHVADSPMDRPTVNGRIAPPGQLPVPPVAATPSSTASPAQVKAIYAIARSGRGMNEEAVDEECRKTYGQSPTGLTKQQASEYIDRLKGTRALAEEAPKDKAPVGEAPAATPAAAPTRASERTRQDALATLAKVQARGEKLQITIAMPPAGATVGQIDTYLMRWQALLKRAEQSLPIADALSAWSIAAGEARELGLPIEVLRADVAMTDLVITCQALQDAIHAELERRSALSNTGTGGR